MQNFGPAETVVPFAAEFSCRAIGGWLGNSFETQLSNSRGFSAIHRNDGTIDE